eukprot:6211871-Pleurochrysis_carterae.AAC.2
MRREDKQVSHSGSVRRERGIIVPEIVPAAVGHDVADEIALAGVARPSAAAAQSVGLKWRRLGARVVLRAVPVRAAKAERDLTRWKAKAQPLNPARLLWSSSPTPFLAFALWPRPTASPLPAHDKHAQLPCPERLPLKKRKKAISKRHESFPKNRVEVHPALLFESALKGDSQKA